MLTAGSSGTHRTTRHRACRDRLELGPADRRRAGGVRSALAVFAGRFDLDGGERADRRRDARTTRSISCRALVDKSMVVADRGESLRSGSSSPCGSTGWSSSGSRAKVEDAAVRHAEHYATLVESLAARYQSPDELDAGRRLDAARENLRAAFAFAAAREDVDLAFRIVAALSDYSNQRVWTEPWGWSKSRSACPALTCIPCVMAR